VSELAFNDAMKLAADAPPVLLDRLQLYQQRQQREFVTVQGLPFFDSLPGGDDIEYAARGSRDRPQARLTAYPPRRQPAAA
jgi:hypothetical protein